MSQHQKPSSKTIELIASTMIPMGASDEFSKAFTIWAQQWSGPQNYKSPTAVREWNPEIRPYSVTELCSLPGMPGRTKMHEILKSLNIPFNQLRNEGGKLTPIVVKLIFQRLSESR